MASEVKVLVACGSGIATSTVAQEKVKEILRDAKIPAKITKGTVGPVSYTHLTLPTIYSV
mgnify:CR=1 FL=1